MVAKTLEVQAATGQSSMTASAYPIGTDTVAAQVSAAALTEATNRLGWYTCTADDLAAGDYQIKVLSSGGVLVASWMARIAAGAATYQCHESLPDTIPTVTTVGTTTTNTDMRGTDSAATATSLTTLTTTVGAAGAGLTEAGGTGDHLTAMPWNAAWDAEVESEVNDAIDTAISELGVGAPTATPTIRTGMMLMYMALRNKTVTQTSGTDALEVYNDAGTIIAKKLLTDDGDDYTAAEMTSG
jgi:hypothetical protein